MNKYYIFLNGIFICCTFHRLNIFHRLLWSSLLNCSTFNRRQNVNKARFLFFSFHDLLCWFMLVTIISGNFPFNSPHTKTRPSNYVEFIYFVVVVVRLQCIRLNKHWNETSLVFLRRNISSFNDKYANVNRNIQEKRVFRILRYTIYFYNSNEIHKKKKTNWDNIISFLLFIIDCIKQNMYFTRAKIERKRK